MGEEKGKVFYLGEILRILHVQIKYLAIKKEKFMLLFLFGFNPNIRYGDRLVTFETSPWLIAIA